MTLLLDTYAVVELFLGSDKGQMVKEMLAEDPDVMISALTIYETGVFLERRIGKERTREYLISMEDHWEVIDVGPKVAYGAVELKRNFKLPAIDCMIYSSARLNEAKVVSGCRHFRSISDQSDVIILN